MKNRQILLVSRPTGEPTADNFKLVETEVPQPKDGEMLLKTIYLSLDPYMRSRMNDTKSYTPPVKVGAVMGGQSISQVVESRVPEFKPGDVVMSVGDWQEYSISDKRAQKLDSKVAPISTFLGVLGMPGLTAYVGLMNIGQPKSGETLVVASAAGAVGAIVGQMAKIKGLRVIGIAGGPEKCGYVKGELGFDDCLDHHAPELRERLQEACPNGVDIYFENVGGPVSDAVFPLLNNYARVPVCGLIAYYNASEPPPVPNRVPRLMQAMLVKRLTFKGFIVLDHADQYPAFLRDVSAWMREGKIKYREDITEGLENAPRELIGLLKGKNFGKKLILVSPDPTR
jgi:NADPH-dependent curcumin reductase